MILDDDPLEIYVNDVTTPKGRCRRDDYCKRDADDPLVKLTANKEVICLLFAFWRNRDGQCGLLHRSKSLATRSRTCTNQRGLLHRRRER